MNIYNEAIQEKDIKNNKKLNYSTIKDQNNYNKITICNKKNKKLMCIYFRKFKNQSCTVNVVCCLGDKRNSTQRFTPHIADFVIML